MSLKWTVTEGAKAEGITVQAMTKRIKAVGLPTAKGHRYSLKDFVTIRKAQDNDKEAIIKARRKKLEEEAALLEYDRLEREKVLVNLNDVLRLVEAPWVVVRQRMLALPAEAAAKCNPGDPDLAREALDGWLNYSLASIRDQLPKSPVVEPKPQPAEQPEGEA